MKTNSLEFHEVMLDTPFFSKMSMLHIGLLMVISAGLCFPFSFIKGFSFFMGGLIHGFPLLLFGKLFFRKTKLLNAQGIVRTFYIGEMLKLIFTFLCFYMAFHWSLIQPSFLFVGYVVSLFIYWILLLKLAKTPSTNPR